MIHIHNKAPQFSLPDQEGKMHTLEQYADKKVLLYFYPKDDTPGCTAEACNFRDNIADIQSLGLIVLGVSADSIKSHKKFKEKYNLPFPLLSDETKEVCMAYDVWKEKKFMGKTYMGISRMSFLIDEKGYIAKVYEEVKPKEHTQEVLRDVH